MSFDNQLSYNKLRAEKIRVAKKILFLFST